MLFMMLQPWLALETTNSAFWVGATVGASGAGLLTFSVVGGVLADRFERRSVLVASLCIQIAASMAIAVLAFSDQIRLGFIMLFGFVDAAMLYNRIARIGENGPAGAVVSGRSRAG